MCFSKDDEPPAEWPGSHQTGWFRSESADVRAHHATCCLFGHQLWSLRRVPFLVDLWGTRFFCTSQILGVPQMDWETYDVPASKWFWKTFVWHAEATSIFLRHPALFVTWVDWRHRKPMVCAKWFCTVEPQSFQSLASRTSLAPKPRFENFLLIDLAEMRWRTTLYTEHRSLVPGCLGEQETVPPAICEIFRLTWFLGDVWCIYRFSNLYPKLEAM